MKVLVTGAKGQLGHDVMLELAARGHEGVGVDVGDMDITDACACERVITHTAPDAVIHCAAWTAVDAAEDSAEACRRVNAQGTDNIARVCKALGCKMMYLSTDYVFDGQGERPWRPEDPASPLNVYGQTKWEGEQAVRAQVEKHFIVRIAWVFGLNGKNFVKTMLNLARTRDHLTVVNDQIGTPTYTADLARLLVDMIETDRYGTYHATNEGGYISWYDFACEIFRLAGVSGMTVTPVRSAEYPAARAKRPFNSRLNKAKLAENGFAPLPEWQDALARYLQALSRQA